MKAAGVDQHPAETGSPRSLLLPALILSGFATQPANNVNMLLLADIGLTFAVPVGVAGRILIITKLASLWGWRSALLVYVLPVSILALLVAARGVASSQRSAAASTSVSYLRAFAGVLSNHSAARVLILQLIQSSSIASSDAPLMPLNGIGAVSISQFDY